MAKSADERRSGPRLTIYMPKEEQDAVFKAAEALGMSRSQFVRLACDEAVRSRYDRGEIVDGVRIPFDIDELEKLWASRMRLAVFQMRQDFEFVYTMIGLPNALGYERQKGLLELVRERNAKEEKEDEEA